VISSLIHHHRGRVVDSPGDNLLAEFASVVDAVRCAVEIQHELKAKNAELPDPRQMRFRIGINLGDVIVEGERLYGDGVNIAARMESLALPGGICISGTVHDHVKSKLALDYEDLGPQQVKNIVRPVEVYRVMLDSTTAVVRGRAQPATRTRMRPSRRAWIIVSVAAIGMGMATWTATRFLLSPAVIAPYSIEDRRMTFAVLPFQPPAGDTGGEQVAAAMTEAVVSSLEGRSRLAQVASRNLEEDLLRQQTPLI
jgi:adenylate cyclase